jgi:translation initiation factor IF-3
MEPAHRHKINHEISAGEIRVLDEEGKMLGLMTKSAALRLAEEKELDLVEIAPKAEPPVCRVIDYGKYLYELQKKEKQQRKHQQQQQMKELRFKWRTDTHDFNFKLRHAKNFLMEGNKVKASIVFRGREITHQEIGRDLLERFVAGLDDCSKVDQPVKFEGKAMYVILAPDKIRKKSTP